MPIRFRYAVSALALVAVLGAAACESAPPPAPPPPVYVAPPPPPLPNLALSQTVIDHAAIYQGYLQRASAIQTPFTDTAAIQTSLRTSQAYQAQQLQRGAVAYGAVVALQDPTFVAAVRELGRDPTQRAGLVQRLLTDPNYAVAFNGSASAAGLVVSALSTQANTLLATGNRVKQHAYDIQRQRWSLADIPARPERLREAQRVGQLPLTADPSQSAPLRMAAYGEAPLSVTAASVNPPYTPTVARALAVAALAALGEADGANAPAVEALLTEPTSGSCLNLSKLMLYQCLSVAKPWYEDVFCVGQHILIDTANCLNRAAGAATPIVAPTTPATTTAQVTPVPQASVNAAAAGASPAQATAAANAPVATSPAPTTPR